MANEIIAGNSSIVSAQFNINQLYTLPNAVTRTTIYTTAANEYLDLTVINNLIFNRTIQIESVSDVGGSSVIASIAALASVNVFNTANRLIVPPGYSIIINGGSAFTNNRVIVQGTRFYNSP
jgi:hypothetical protein